MFPSMGRATGRLDLQQPGGQGRASSAPLIASSGDHDHSSGLPASFPTGARGPRRASWRSATGSGGRSQMPARSRTGIKSASGRGAIQAAATTPRCLEYHRHPASSDRTARLGRRRPTRQKAPAATPGRGCQASGFGAADAREGPARRGPWGLRQPGCWGRKGTGRAARSGVAAFRLTDQPDGWASITE